jgi:hypothetical protein
VNTWEHLKTRPATSELIKKQNWESVLLINMLIVVFNFPLLYHCVYSCVHVYRWMQRCTSVYKHGTTSDFGCSDCKFYSEVTWEVRKNFGWETCREASTQKMEELKWSQGNWVRGCIHLVQNIDRWWALVNTVWTFWLHKWRGISEAADRLSLSRTAPWSCLKSGQETAGPERDGVENLGVP